MESEEFCGGGGEEVGGKGRGRRVRGWIVG